ncbi:autotransporter domain-containing protein [Acetobacter sp.]|uniref:autotransporter outer membrane beta-barrel domain-containing protein n=1 Tax=Acetobacter sp. TaxID=440 RepID=UPI0039EA5014
MQMREKTEMVAISRNRKNPVASYCGAVKIGFLTTLLCGVAAQTFSPAHAQTTYPNTVTFSPSGASSLSTIIADTVSGPVSVLMNGTGIQSLSDMNTYTGATTISNGTLALIGSASIASSAGVHNNATLDISGSTQSSVSIQSLDGTGNIVTGSNPDSHSPDITITNGNSTFGNTFSGTISGNGGLLISGGSETLSGGNTYTGSTGVSSGATLTVSDDGSLNGTNNIKNDGTVVFDNAYITVPDNTGANWTGVIATGFDSGSTANMTLQNGSTINSTWGTLTTGFGSGSSGTVTVDNSSITESVVVAGEHGNGAISIQNGGSVAANRVILGNQSTGSGRLDVTGAGSQLNIGSDGLYVNADGSGTVSIQNGGTISSAGPVSFGDGSTVASGSTGTLTVAQGGTLAVGGTNGIVDNEGTNGRYAFNLAGGTLEVDNTDLTTSVNMTLVDGTNSTVNTQTLNTTTLSGVLSGNGSLTAAGGGSLVLTGANTYTGNTLVTGNLTVSGGGSLNGTNSIMDEGTVVLDNGHITIPANTGTNGTGVVAVGVNNNNGSMTLENGSTIVSPTGTLATGWDASDSGSVTVDNSSIQEGSVAVGEAGNGTITIQNGGTVTADKVVLGNQAGTSSGLLEITGTGSQLNAGSGGVYVNAGGTGTLYVDGGGTLNSAGPISFGDGSTVTSGSRGVLGVGAGSTIAVGGTNGIVDNEGSAGSYAFYLAGGTLKDTGSDLTSAVNITLFYGTNSTVDTNGLNTTLSGVLSGDSASLTKAGSGTLLLSGQNTYTGGTNITGGTLVGTTSSFGSGGIVDDAALEVAQETSGILANPLSGTGSFTKSGTGSVGIEGDDSAFTGTTSLVGGTLDVGGSLANSAVSVSNGGTLAGTGTVGNTQIATGGILAPASSGQIGTMTVNGNLGMAAGSTLVIDATGTPTGASLSVNGTSYQRMNSDLVNVMGAVTLSGGTVRLNVAGAPTLQYGQAYQIVSSAQGVSGRYDGLTTNLGNAYTFLTPSLVYGAESVDIMQARNTVTFASVGNSRNERTTGGALDSLPTGNPVAGAVSQLGAQGARAAFNALSGEVHASARTALIQDSFFVRQAALDRLESAGCDSASADGTIRTANLHTQRDDGCHADRAMLWGEAYGSLGHNAGDGNAATMQHSTAGFVMGVDAPVMETWRIGGLISYGRSMFDIGSGRASSGHSNNVSVGGYAGTHWGRLNLRLGATYTWDMLSTSRTVAVPGLGERLSSGYLGGTAQGFGELSYRLHAGRSIIEPFGNVAYVNLHTDSYHEHGNAGAVNGKAMDTGVTFSTFGLRVSSAMRVGKLVLVPHGMLAYRHAFGLTVPTQRQNFASLGSAGMDIAGVALSTNAAVLDTGLTARLTDRIDVGLSYIGQYGNQSVESGAKAHVRFRF